MSAHEYTSSALIPFQFDNFSCPVRLDDHGVPWWGLLDVCRAITLRNTTDAAKRLRPHETTILDFIEDGMPHRLLLVNEAGLYRLIMRSNKPEAERFQDWVCQEVLPQIRKTGQYTPSPKQLTTSEMFLAQATINVEFERRQFAIEARQKTLESTQAVQAATLAALQERQPPDGKSTVRAFLKRYSKPFLPKEILDALKYCCRQAEKPELFRPDGSDYADNYYSLHTLNNAYAEATRQLSFLVPGQGRHSRGDRP